METMNRLRYGDRLLIGHYAAATEALLAESGNPKNEFTVKCRFNCRGGESGGALYLANESAKRDTDQMTLVIRYDEGPWMYLEEGEDDSPILDVYVSILAKKRSEEFLQILARWNEATGGALQAAIGHQIELRQAELPLAAL